MKIIEIILTGIVSFITGGAGLGLLIPSYADWQIYRNLDNPTDEDLTQCEIAKKRCLISLVCIAVCLVFMAVFIHLMKAPEMKTGSGVTIDAEHVDTLPDTSESSERIQRVENQSYSNGIYIGYYDTVSRCPEGSGVMLFDNGDTYEGEWLQGKKHGHGIMTYYNRDVYDGDWANDVKHGHGRYTWYNGGSYDGDYENDKRNGMGTYKNWTGSIYSNEIWTGEYYGEHKDNVFDGYGKFTITNGDVFEGIFKDGRAWDGTYTRNGVAIEIKCGVQV